MLKKHVYLFRDKVLFPTMLDIILCFWAGHKYKVYLAFCFITCTWRVTLNGTEQSTFFELVVFQQFAIFVREKLKHLSILTTQMGLDPPFSNASNEITSN